MISVNERATTIVQQMINDCEALGVRVKRLKNGADVIDAGVEAPGSMEAGRLFACACMGGLGQVSFNSTDLRFGESRFLAAGSSGGSQLSAYRLHGFTVRGLGCQARPVFRHWIGAGARFVRRRGNLSKSWTIETRRRRRS